jgi:acetolactate decarboxylase
MFVVEEKRMVTKKLNSLYVSAPVNALVTGILREDKTLKQVLEHGNFGLGTFNDLDGEMVLLGGVFYHLHANGTTHIADVDMKTPYACVTHFKPEVSLICNDELTFDRLKIKIDEMVLSKNLIYAIRVAGTFKSIKARSVPKQEAYRPLVDVAGDQKEFLFEDTEGTLVGFYTPNFMGSVTVPGYHLHFISNDRENGGHLLGCVSGDVEISVQSIDQLMLDLPHSVEYLTASLNNDVRKDLDKAEH